MSAVAAVCSALAAAASLCVVWMNGSVAAGQAQSAAVQQAVNAYLIRYAETLKEVGSKAIACADGYQTATPDHQNDVQIFDGTLVAMVDAMYFAKDQRADVFATHIRDIPGPLLAGFPLVIYASHPKTKEAIRDAERAVRLLNQDGRDPKRFGFACS